MIKDFQEKDSYKWVVLAISFLQILTFAITLQVLPPIFDNITKDIAFTSTQAGTLMGAYAIPAILISFLIAYSIKKVSPKTMIILGQIIMIIGLIAFSFSDTYLSLLIWRIFIGIGATIMVVLSPLLVTMFFKNKSVGIAMGIFNIAVPLGTVFSANVFGILGQVFNWRTIILGIAVFVGIVLIIVFFSLAIPKEDTGDLNKTGMKVQEKFKMNLGLFLLGLIWVIINLQMLAYITFGPQYFQSVGISAQRAGLLASFLMLMPIFISPLAGVFFDKVGKEKEVLIIGSIIVGIAFTLISRSYSTIPLWAVALGIGIAPFPVFVFSYLPKIVEAHHIGMGLGMLTVASNIGTTIGPAIFGLILDISGGKFFLGFMFLAILSIVVIGAVIGLKIKKTQIEL